MSLERNKQFVKFGLMVTIRL